MRPGDVDLADPTMVIRHEGTPNDYFALLRRDAPVFWNEISDAARSDEPPMTDGFWVLTKYADIVRASKEHETFSSQLGGPILWDLREEQLATQRAGMMA